IPAKHLMLLCAKLEAVERGEITRLMVFLPPRHGKSEVVSKKFPAWYLGRNPKKEIILTSYAADLSLDHSRIARDTAREQWEKLWPGVKLSKDSGSAERWTITRTRGGLTAAGVGGAITGRGAHCFPAGTLIDTEIGKMPIEILTSMNNPPLVLSYDHNSDILVYRRIISSRKKWSSEFTEVSTFSGRKIKSTREHRYYDCERGYREAQFLRAGDRLISSEVPKQQDMPCMQQAEERQGFPLSGMFRQGEENRSCSEMCLLRDRVCKAPLRIRKGDQEGAYGFLLFPSMQSVTSCGEKCKQMCSMWETPNEGQDILRACLQKVNDREETREESLPSMQYRVSTNIQQDNLLFKEMCGSCSLKENGRHEQFTLQRWNELCQMVYGNAPNNSDKGQLPMCGLWGARGISRNSLAWQGNTEVEHGYSPYRRERNGQYIGKSSYSMRDLPSESSYVNNDTVSEVKNIYGESVPVYDLQVEGTSNYFANGILVHNCAIIDDPVKNQEEADSETMRNKVWEWYLTVLRTRLAPGGAIILVMTRWHEDDLAGRLLEEMKNGGEQWEVISLPAEAEENDALGREPGEWLWPERFSPEEYQAIKKTLGSRHWNALYQQRPSPAEGSLIKREWWKFYKQPPAFFSHVIQSWDCTFKDKETADFVVGQVWGKSGANMYLLDMVRARMDLPTTITAIRTLSDKWPNAFVKLIEDKANGPAVIQMLRNTVGGLIAVNPMGGKVARVNAVSPAIEAGNVYLPEDAPWVHDFIEECAAFPNGKYDDAVDSMSQSLSKLVYYVSELPTAESPFTHGFKFDHPKPNPYIGGDADFSYINFGGG
ncbi:MAG: phage terminase large subunit, partial [Dehalococcoidales bacterium]|nr:phage terminase large subunit [Dehalococcoidales bacterium]